MVGSFKDDYAERRCRKHAGPYFDQLLNDYSVAIDFLRHPDPRARLGSLAMLFHYWGTSEDIRNTARQMALLDDDELVRGMALIHLAASSEHGDRTALRWLAEIVMNEEQPVQCRWLAYCWLFVLADIDSDSSPSPMDCQFPDAVDWSFVRSFLE